MDANDLEAWKAVKKIIDSGETAEVRMTKDGIKVYERKCKLMFGKSDLKKGRVHMGGQ